MLKLFLLLFTVFSSNCFAIASGSVLFSNGTAISENNTNFFWDDPGKYLRLGGQLVLGVASAPSSDIAFDIVGARSMRVGRVTTTQRNSLTAVAGATVFNTDTAQLEYYDGTNWGSIAPSASLQPLISAGTSAQYYRGDKTWQSLTTSAVAESGNLYYTDARARAAFSATAPIALSGSGVVSCASASGSQAGCLSSSDWSTFNGKQVAGSYLSALNGDVSATGPGTGSSVVNSVGGSSSSLIHSAELAANGASSGNTASAIIKRDASGNFSAGSITASLSGNASTASALASTPSGCSAGQYASAIAANGNLTCSTPAGSGVSSVAASSPLASSGGATPTISCQAASGSQAGCLSSSNWTTFNNKEPAISTGSVGQYFYYDKSWRTPAVVVTPSTPTRSLNSAGFQVSTTKASFVDYSVAINCTASLSGGQTGSIELRSDSNSTPTIVRSTAANANSVALAIALTVVNNQTIPISALVPAGHYVRLVSSGTCSMSIVSQNEVPLEVN